MLESNVGKCNEWTSFRNAEKHSDLFVLSWIKCFFSDIEWEWLGLKNALNGITMAGEQWENDNQLGHLMQKPFKWVKDIFCPQGKGAHLLFFPSSQKKMHAKNSLATSFWSAGRLLHVDECVNAYCVLRYSLVSNSSNTFFFNLPLSLYL